MKVELVKETNPMNSEEWFGIYVDGHYKTGGTNEFRIKRLYFEIISDPSILEKTKEVLHSAEFIVASEYKK
jgi:hypothetical protein